MNIIKSYERVLPGRLMTGICSVMLFSIGMFAFSPNVTAQASTPDSEVLQAIQNEITYLNDEYDDLQGSSVSQHNPELISYYQEMFNHYEQTGNIYRSIALELDWLFVSIDPGSDLFLNIFKPEYHPSTGGNPGQSGGYIYYPEDDVLFSYNFVQSQFKSIVEDVKDSNDVNDVNVLLSFIRDSR